MIIDLSAIATGFADPVHDAQRGFRALLDAVARPGRIGSTDASAVDAPPSMPAAMANCVLVLCDGTTPVWLSASLRDDPRVVGFVRFHTESPIVDAPRDAAYAFCARADLPALALSAFESGSDERPQDGATLVIEVAGFDARVAQARDPRHTATAEHAGGPVPAMLTLRGPGIESHEDLRVAGIAETFWHARVAMQPAYPAGVDLILCAGARWLAIPRSTQIEADLEETF